MPKEWRLLGSQSAAWVVPHVGGPWRLFLAIRNGPKASGGLKRRAMPKLPPIEPRSKSGREMFSPAGAESIARVINHRGHAEDQGLFKAALAKWVREDDSAMRGFIIWYEKQ